MKNKNWVAMLLCGAILLGGCGNSGADTKETGLEDVSAQEDVAEGAGMQEGVAEKTNMQEGVADETDMQKGIPEKTDTQQATEEGNSAEKVDTSGAAAENGSLVIEAGPDKPVYRSKFLLMQVDIQNIDYQGDGNDGDGEMNLSLFTIAPKEQNESDEWGGSLPVYLSEPGQKASDYYHVFVKPGDTRTIAVGFYVPVNDSEELRSQCRISLYGNMDEGYVYEIPKVQ